MKEQKAGLFIVILIIAIAIASLGGYYAGKNAAASRYEKKQAQLNKKLEQAEEQRQEVEEEKKLDIEVNRSDLEGLGEIEGEIYVTGHKCPDSDTVGSSIGYAALLRKLGYDARPVVLGELNNETKYVLEKAGLEEPELLEDVAGCNMVLVDHSDYEQSAEGLKDACVITIIDHHGDGSVRTGNQLIYDAEPLGATATIVWKRYRDYGLEPDKQTALVMLGSILSDTHKLEYNSTTTADKEAAKQLAELSGISDLDTFYEGMSEAALSYKNMSDEKIYFSDYKEYDAAGKKYGIACINTTSPEKAEELANRMKRVMPSAVASQGMDMAFAQIGVNKGDISITYLVPSDEVAADVIEAAFGDKVTFSGNYYSMSPSVSRKKVIVPAITDVLNSYPKE